MNNSTPLLHYVRHYDLVTPPALVESLMEWFHQGELLERKTLLYEFSEKEVNPQKDKALSDALCKVVNHALQRYVPDCGISKEQWPTHYVLEGFRMKRYRGGNGKFDPHVDVTDKKTCSRFLVVMLYLSTRPDNCKGGSTMFADGLEIDPVACRVALFPPLWPWLHAGGSPQGWDKYTIQTYLHYD